MGFLDFFRPRWRHSDIDIRSQAVRDLPDDDLTTLEKVATKDPDARVRRIAVKKIYDPELLRRVAEKDADDSLRQAAAEKATEVLTQEAMGDTNAEQQLDPLRAVRELDDAHALAQIARRAKRADVQQAALAKLTDDRLLTEVALRAEVADLRLAALQRIREQAHVRDVALGTEHKALAHAAVARLTDLAMLAVVARDAKSKVGRAAARDKLPEEKPTDDDAPRTTAPARKKIVSSMPKAEAKKLRARKLQVCLAIEPMCKNSSDWATIEAKVAEARDQWLEIGDVPGGEQLEQRFADAIATYQKRKKEFERDREIAAAREREAAEKRARDAAEEAARKQAEASAEAKRADEQQQRAARDAERDAERARRDEEKRAEAERAAAPPTVEEQLAQLAARAERLLDRDRILPDRVTELETKWKELDPDGVAPAPVEPPAVVAVAAVEPPITLDPALIPAPPVLPPDVVAASGQSAVDDGWDEPTIPVITHQIPPAEVAAAAPAPAAAAAAAPAPAAAAAAPAPAAAPAAAPASPLDGLRRRFFAALATARTRAEAARAQLEAERATVHREITQACERLERLLESNDSRKIDAAIRQAKANLKAHRPSTSDTTEQTLLARLTQALDALTTRSATLREAEGWRRWANLPQFEQLIKEAEALVEILDTVEDKRGTPGVLKELQARWKAAGALPQEQSQTLWDRFKKACDAAYDKSKAFFATLDAAQPENLAAKIALCEKVEAIAAAASAETDYKSTSEQVKALQEEWKQVGPVPREQSEDLWKRFRAACDAFFAKRGEHDKSRDQERAAAVAAKTALCEQAEQLAASTDWRAAADALKGLQEQWKQTGYVPRKQGDELWNRFRGACDRFFAARKAQFAEQDAERNDNLTAKLKLCEQAEQLGELEDRDEAMERAKQLQREWKNIGHVPREMSDEIWTRFRAACDKVFEGPADDEAEALPPPPVAGGGEVGIGGFVNRLPLEGIAAKLAASKLEPPAPAADGEPEADPDPAKS